VSTRECQEIVKIGRHGKRGVTSSEDEKKRANLISLAMTIAFHRLKEAWVREWIGKWGQIYLWEKKK